MRARNLKPGFFKNEELAELPLATRVIFQGLWCLADRFGRLQDRPKRIKAEVLPYDDVDIDAALQQLYVSGFIVRYTVGDARYIAIPKFLDHQNPHKAEPESVIPPPSAAKRAEERAETLGALCENDTHTVQELNLHDANAEVTRLNPDSGILNNDDDNTGAPAREDGPQDPIDEVMANPDHSAAAYCAQNLAGMTPGNYAELRDFAENGIADDLVRYAVDEAVAQGKRTWAYVRRILDGYIAGGIKTIGAAKAEHERFAAEKIAAMLRGSPRASPSQDPREDISWMRWG